MMLTLPFLGMSLFGDTLLSKVPYLAERCNRWDKLLLALAWLILKQ